MFKNKETNYKKIKNMIDYLNNKIENKELNSTIMLGIGYFISQQGKVIIEDDYFYGVDKYNYYSFKIKINDSLIVIEETNFHGNLSTTYNIRFIDEKSIITIIREDSKYVNEYSREVVSTETKEIVRAYIDNILRYEDKTIFSVDYDEKNNNYEIDKEELFVDNNKGAVYSKKTENIFLNLNSEKFFISENKYCKTNNYKSVFFNNRKKDIPNICINGFDYTSKEVFDNMKITQMKIIKLVEENRNLKLIDSNEHVILNKPKTKIMKKIFEFIKD